MSFSQFLPSNPLGHWQKKKLGCIEWHVPPFLQNSSISHVFSISQYVPLKSVPLQLQEKDLKLSIHLPCSQGFEVHSLSWFSQYRFWLKYYTAHRSIFCWVLFRSAVHRSAKYSLRYILIRFYISCTALWSSGRAIGCSPKRSLVRTRVWSVLMRLGVWIGLVS